MSQVDELSDNERVVLDELGPPAEWYDRLIELGQSAYRLAQDLSADDVLHAYLLQDALDPGEPYLGIPTFGAELAAAEEFVGALPTMRSRVQEVIWNALSAHSSPRVAGYLRRLGRCYVAGFDAEAVIVCRAVLDVALRDVLGDGPSGPTNMYQRIEMARHQGFLSEEGASGAHAIRTRGNKAVHEEPANPDIAADTVEMTMRILFELFAEEL